MAAIKGRQGVSQPEVDHEDFCDCMHYRDRHRDRGRHCFESCAGADQRSFYVVDWRSDLATKRCVQSVKVA